MRSRITEPTVRGAWAGPARLQLFEHALAPLADLPVLDIVKATHVLTDLTLPRAEIAHDYLAQPHDFRTNTPCSSRKELK